jgi:hypothetical protein
MDVREFEAQRTSVVDWASELLHGTKTAIGNMAGQLTVGLTPDTIRALGDLQHGACFMTGVPLYLATAAEIAEYGSMRRLRDANPRDDYPRLARYDNTGDWVAGNIVLVSETAYQVLSCLDGSVSTAMKFAIDVVRSRESGEVELAGDEALYRREAGLQEDEVVKWKNERNKCDHTPICSGTDPRAGMTTSAPGQA